MENFKLLSQKNLLDNLQAFSSKKICAMVKSNAYGHGLDEIVKILDGKVSYFGVANVEEGVRVRRLTSSPILVVGKVQDFKRCKRFDLEFMVDCETDLKNAIAFNVSNQCHLKINCGMNRFGVNSELNMKILDNILSDNGVVLKSVYTHFPNTQNRKQTCASYQRFLALKSKLSQNPLVCFGGSEIAEYPFKFDMLRLGIGLYGYGKKELEPVMKIFSFVCETMYVKSGEFIGYGQVYQVEHDGIFAVVPVGYGDGLQRRLGGRICVRINGKKFPVVGDICMDVFFARVDETVKVGDVVEVMQDAEVFAKKLGTISYEVLTGFSNFRGVTKVE